MRRLLLAAVVLVFACNDIESRRRSTAPLNASSEFPCERYEKTSVNAVSAVPTDGRCIVPGAVNYDFTVLVDVPESSLYAPGHTFVLTSKQGTSSDLTVVGTDRRAKLPVIGAVVGAYTVKFDVSKRVLAPKELPDGTSFPVRAVYRPIGRGDNDYDPALPLDVLFATSRTDENQSPRVSYVRSLPLGRWSRSLEPAPPWDAIFPPHIDDEFEVKRSGDQVDFVDIGGASGDFDDVGGLTRNATVTRSEGLEGWTLFLRDNTTKRRVSTLKTLCNGEPECTVTRPNDCCVSTRAEARTRLDTLRGSSALDGVEAVLAPPTGWIGVPTLVDPPLAASGIPLKYPPDLRPPIALEGIVAASADAGVFLAVASRMRFESKFIALASGETPLLQYSTTVSTDDRGRFATVIPPGTYRVTVEPLEGTKFASFRQDVIIADDKPITLSPPKKTHVRGVALLSDGRAAANAQVIAIAAPLADTSAQPPPRPARTTVTEDGTFAVDLDQGAYVLTVMPEEGTGFPRVVTRATIPADQADIGVVRIPPPTRLGLQIVDPTTVARPIPLANVRIFASPEGGGGPLLEVGSGMTNGTGRVEILLAQQPK